MAQTSPNVWRFVADSARKWGFSGSHYLPTAHSLACLRFAESVTVSGARLATGRAGSPFAGRVSHPLDDEQGFMKSSHTPFPLDQPCLVALDLILRI